MPFDYLQHYQTFHTVADMDTAIAVQLSTHDLTKSERAVLRRIAQSALKYPGAAHLKAATIAKSIGVSTKTVYRAVKRLHMLGILQIIASTKLNGIKGANIYQILSVPTKMSERIETGRTHQNTTEAPCYEKETISFNLLKTSTLYTIYNNATLYLNTWQKTLYELMISLPLADEWKDELYFAIVSTQLSSMREFTVARDTLMRIILDIHHGTLTVRTTLRAVFKGAYNKAITRHKPTQQKEPKTAPRPVPFYDWLTIRAEQKR